jgi:hypothetical protein
MVVVRIGDSDDGDFEGDNSGGVGGGEDGWW